MILTAFNWNVVIGLAITLVVYLLFLAIFSIVKKFVHKKRFEKEQKKREEATGVTIETKVDDGKETKN